MALKNMLSFEQSKKTMESVALSWLELPDARESTIKRRMKEWNIAWLGHPKTGHWVFVKDIQ